MMRIFFDTVFTGRRKNMTLISIGLVDENNRAFYAELTDYDQSQVEDWRQEDVIDKLTLGTNFPNFKSISVPNDDEVTRTWMMKGESNYVALRLMNWLDHCSHDEIEFEFVSDVCHYDFVLLLDLLYGLEGKEVCIPPEVSKACHDINQDLAIYFNTDSIEASHMNREETLLKAFGVEMDGTLKHNALYDARVIRELYMALHR